MLVEWRGVERGERGVAVWEEQYSTAVHFSLLDHENTGGSSALIETEQTRYRRQVLGRHRPHLGQPQWNLRVEAHLPVLSQKGSFQPHSAAPLLPQL